MASSLRIGLAQYNTAWEDPLANIHQVEDLLQGEHDLDLLVLPEMWSTGFTMNTATATTEKTENAEDAEEATATTEKTENAEDADDLGRTAFGWMKRKSAELQMHIAGSIAVKDGDQYFNRFYCVSPAGEIQRYDKKHLFSYGKEDHHYAPGHQQLTFQLGDWKIRAIVCYDLRFPVWCRNNDNYDILLVVANWPEARIHHWDALLKARAIENQCYVVGVNRVGTDGNQLDYPGHSAVYDMNGLGRLEMTSRVGIEKVILEKDQLTQFRTQYRFLQDRDQFSL
jgi:predicted amidohydrolase